jgi:hypothetical protein
MLLGGRGCTAFCQAGCKAGGVTAGTEKGSSPFPRFPHLGMRALNQGQLQLFLRWDRSPSAPSAAGIIQLLKQYGEKVPDQ